MTTSDIQVCQISLVTKEGKMLLGSTNDQILLAMIASYVKFVEIDESKFESVMLSEIIKRQ